MKCTKTEVYNLSQCCQVTRAKQQPQVTCTENLVKFGHVVFEIRVQRDDMLMMLLCTLTVGELTKTVAVEICKIHGRRLCLLNEAYSAQIWHALHMVLPIVS